MLKNHSIKLLFSSKISLCCIAFCFLFNHKITAQSQIAGGFQVGKIIKHTQKLTIPQNTQTVGFWVDFLQKKPLKKENIGLKLFWTDLGDKQILGNAWAINPYFEYDFLNANRYKISANLGTGIAYLNKPYHPLKNPLNNAIGSHLNAVFSLNLKQKYFFKPNFAAQLEAGITHFSNGSYQYPNFGLNIAQINAALLYQFSNNQKLENTEQKFSLNSKKSAFQAQIGMALSEWGALFGPKYPIYNTAFSYQKRLKGSDNFLLFGTAFEWNKAVYRYGIETYYLKKNIAAQKALRWMLFVGDAYKINHIALFFQIGIYIPPYDWETVLPFYTQAGIRYYLPLYENKNLFLGFHLKTHLANAEYIALNLGFEW